MGWLRNFAAVPVSRLAGHIVAPVSCTLFSSHHAGISAGGANGFHQLPDAIDYRRIDILWNRPGLFWKVAAVRNLLCGHCHLGISNPFQPYLVALFPLWSAGMAVEKFDVLEETAVAEGSSK